MLPILWAYHNLIKQSQVIYISLFDFQVYLIYLKVFASTHNTVMNIFVHKCLSSF